MESIKKLFQPLHNRLYSFEEKSRYKFFNCLTLIHNIKSEILSYAFTEIVTEVEDVLLKIRNLRERNNDFSECFYVTEDMDILFQDEYGNKAIVKSEEVVPMTESQKSKINVEIIYELNTYQKFLESIKEYCTKEIKLPKTNILAFKLKYLAAEKNIEVLLNSLIANRFIDTKTGIKDFKKVFSGQRPPSNKILWTGTLPTLNYFIHQLQEKQIINDPKMKIWEITRNCFLLVKKQKDGDIIKEIGPNIRTQTLENNDYKVKIDVIIKTISLKLPKNSL